jgi:hypothetical protein
MGEAQLAAAKANTHVRAEKDNKSKMLRKARRD